MREPYQPPTPQPALRITTLLPPLSFPRRRESTPLHPHSQRDDTPPAVYKIRQNPTELYKILQKLVPARAREATGGLLP